MNKTLIAAAVAGIVLLASNAQAQTVPEGYQLQQVLMMSRHNLRAPLANNGSVLEQSTPNKWPEWDVPGGQLTTKGGVLEVYMGHYMREWLAEQGMVKSGECPPPDTVYAYANSLQRTVATAQFFITGAFPGCDIPVHHQEKMGTMDPTFNPVITDDSAAFSEQAVAAMPMMRMARAGASGTMKMKQKTCITINRNEANNHEKISIFTALPGLCAGHKRTKRQEA